MRMMASTFKVDPNGWIQICQTGEYVWGDYIKDKLVEIIQVIDADALQSMLDNFKAGGQEIILDYDHESEDQNKSSRAAGWITDMQIRTDDGEPTLWAKVRPTSSGGPAIEGGDFRYTSPLWLHPIHMQHLGGRRWRPVKIKSVALTNCPRIKGMHPISNRDNQVSSAAPAAREDQKPCGNAAQQKESNMDPIKTLLGLPPEATEADVLAAVTALKDKADAAEAQAKEAQADADLAEASDVIPAANRAAWKPLLMANRESALIAIKGMRSGKDQSVAIPNRGTLPLPQRGAEPAADESVVQIRNREEVRAAKIANRCAELQKINPTLSHSQAWQQAKAEVGSSQAGPR